MHVCWVVSNEKGKSLNNSHMPLPFFALYRNALIMRRRYQRENICALAFACGILELIELD